MSAIYTVFTSPNHAPIPNHLPTLIVTPHGQPTNVLYSYLHTNFNAENYLLTPSPQGDLCVAKMFPPRGGAGAKYAASDPGHSSGSVPRGVRCEASRNLKWTITNTGVMSPIYKLSLPSPDSPDLPLFQVSKPNPNAQFWSMFYFAYAGHLIPPKRIEFGKIQKNPPGPGGGGTRISITGKTPEEKAVWQTLGEGNEDCVEWVVLCAALNLLDDEILKAAEKAGGPPPSMPAQMPPAGRGAPAPQRQGTMPQQGPPNPNGPAGRGAPPPQNGARPPPSGAGQPYPPQRGPPPQGYPQPPPGGQPPRGYAASPGPNGQPQYPQQRFPPPNQLAPGGRGAPPPQQRPPPQGGYPQQNGGSYPRGGPAPSPQPPRRI